MRQRRKRSSLATFYRLECSIWIEVVRDVPRFQALNLAVVCPFHISMDSLAGPGCILRVNS